MAIATLSTLSLDSFKGNRNLTDRDSAGLVGKLNTVIAKINDIISDMNSGSFDVLDVGSGTGTYYGTSDSWMSIDGTNPPTVSLLRIQDQDDGSYGTITNNSGVLTVS